MILITQLYYQKPCAANNPFNKFQLCADNVSDIPLDADVRLLVVVHLVILSTAI